eukprot:1371813-Amphidinium_carterae.1
MCIRDRSRGSSLLLATAIYRGYSWAQHAVGWVLAQLRSSAHASAAANGGLNLKRGLLLVSMPILHLFE